MAVLVIGKQDPYLRYLYLRYSSLRYLYLRYLYQGYYRVSQKKGINKKLLFGAAQGLNLQFLNLFGFSISLSFVWCII